MLPARPPHPPASPACADARPDVLIFALCGFGLAASAIEARKAVARMCEALPQGSGGREALARARVVVVDGARVFSRPGPLLIESAEAVVEALHSEAQAYGHEGVLWRALPGADGAAAQRPGAAPADGVPAFAGAW